MRRLHRIAPILRAFRRDAFGGVAIWFGLMLPVLGLAGLTVVDYSRASSAKQVLQDALDASALIAARSAAASDDDVDAVGDAAFEAQLTALDWIEGFTADESGRIDNVTFTLSGTTVVASASGSIDPIVAGAFFDGGFTIHADTEVVRSITKLEVAMVLDTTGSMSGTKLSNLITAAKNFVTSLESAASTSSLTDPVKISVVPFSTTVRVSDPVDVSSYNPTTHSMTGLPTWLDGRARSTPWNKDLFDIQNSNSDRIDRFEVLGDIGVDWGGCVEAREPPYDIRDTAPDASDVDTLFVPWFWPDEPDTSSSYKNDYLDDDSNGNWSQRQGNPDKYDTTTFKVSGTWTPSWGYGAYWVYGPNAACNMQEIMRLSTSFSSIRSHIDGLVASGETNIPLGLVWGWHTLSPNAPFADGVAYDTQATTKIIVLMTDGDNTMNDPGWYNSNDSHYHGYGYVWQGRVPGLQASASSGTRTDKLNQRMIPNGNGQEGLCDNIKDEGILIYSVGVGVSSDSEDLLTACATSSDYYYDVDSSGTGLDAAFTQIAGSIQNLRISK